MHRSKPDLFDSARLRPARIVRGNNRPERLGIFKFWKPNTGGRSGGGRRR
jgi:hypothetical protein